jgi:hypothetical protein
LCSEKGSGEEFSGKEEPGERVLYVKSNCFLQTKMEIPANIEYPIMNAEVCFIHVNPL